MVRTYLHKLKEMKKKQPVYQTFESIIRSKVPKLPRSIFPENLIVLSEWWNENKKIKTLLLLWERQNKNRTAEPKMAHNESRADRSHSQSSNNRNHSVADRCHARSVLRTYFISWKKSERKQRLFQTVAFIIRSNMPKLPRSICPDTLALSAPGLRDI